MSDETNDDADSVTTVRRLRSDLERARELMRRLLTLAEHMGDKLNEMDVVEDEDLEVAGDVLEASAAFLAPATPETATPAKETP